MMVHGVSQCGLTLDIAVLIGVTAVLIILGGYLYPRVAT